MPNPHPILPIAAGAVFGASLRWLLGLVLSTAPFSLGMLAANWTGALLIGILAEVLENPHYKLLLITGFLGSLTTFSGFSAETVALMQQGRWPSALAALCLHVFGSFALTFAGIKIAQAWQ